MLSLWIASSEPDAALHVYLSEEEPDGRVRYVTEGALRALHRKVSPAPANYRAAWPFHSCNRADADPLIPGTPALLKIALLPTSWVFAEGSRIRVTISGADADHYGHVPHGRPPSVTILRGGDHSSFIDMPLRGAEP